MFKHLRHPSIEFFGNGGGENQVPIFIRVDYCLKSNGDFVETGD